MSDASKEPSDEGEYIPIALRITLLYAVFGLLWIFSSDYVFARLLRPTGLFVYGSVIKGAVFIVITSGLLYGLCRHYLDRIEKQNKSLERSVRSKKTLIRELHHRVRNNLQVIVSLVGLQSRSTDQDHLQKPLDNCRNRVLSIALVHDKLYQNPDITEVEVSDYVHDLIQHLMDTYSEQAPNVECEYHVQTMNLNLDTLIPAGLILCELVSNSLQHAFSENQQGRITVKFEKSAEAQLTVRVSDNGKGLPDESVLTQTDGLGWNLVQTLVNNQLHGSLDWDGSNGFTVTMRFPVQIARYAANI